MVSFSDSEIDEMADSLRLSLEWQRMARDEIRQLRAANAKLRQALAIGYGAMKLAIGRCQATVAECLAEGEEVKTKRLAIFGDLDIPLARVGCIMRASDEALARVDREMVAAIESKDEQKASEKP